MPSPVCGWCGRADASVRLPLGRICVACKRRAAYHPGACPGCSTVRPLAYLSDDGQRVCAGCVEQPSIFACTQCGTEQHPYGASRCARCILRERLTVLLTDPRTGELHAQLRPVFAALLAGERPQTTIYWLRRPPGHGPRILGQMARGQTPISHAAFERLPSDKSHNYLRDLLAALAVLPAYEARIERIMPWLDDLLATLPKPDAEIVERFARWHVIRTLRRKADRNDLTTPVV